MKRFYRWGYIALREKRVETGHAAPESARPPRAVRALDPLRRRSAKNEDAGGPVGRRLDPSQRGDHLDRRTPKRCRRGEGGTARQPLRGVLRDPPRRAHG